MPSRRRSDRVSLTVLLEVSGTDSQGQEFKETGKTLIVSRRGAMIVVGRELKPDQEIHIQRKAPSEAHRQTQARVVNEMGHQRDGNLYSIEIVDPEIDLWGVDFPALPEDSEAVARMLLECTYCHAREVAYLNEVELRAFEANRGIARHCKACRVPSIWTQVPHEDEKKLKARAARTRKASAAHTPTAPDPTASDSSPHSLRSAGVLAKRSAPAAAGADFISRRRRTKFRVRWRWNDHG